MKLLNVVRAVLLVVCIKYSQQQESNRVAVNTENVHSQQPSADDVKKTGITNVQDGKRSLTGDPDWDKVTKAFRETVIRSFLQFDALAPLAKKLFIGHPLGVLTVWVIAIIEAQEQEISAWDAVQEKTDQMIAERLTDDRIASLQPDFDLIQSRLKKVEFGEQEQFGKADLRFIRAKGSTFFPQTYPNNGAWTIKWADAIWKFLVILAGSYIDLMHKEVYDNCKLAKELDELRPQIITAAKKMVKSRYKNLDRNYNSGDRRDIYHVTTGDPAKLSFNDIADPTNDERYHGIPLSHVKSRVLDDIKLRSAEFIEEHLTSKFNSLYNETWTPKSCTHEPPITISDIEFQYPQGCMGKLKGQDQDCSLPCGNYGGKFTFGQNWCVYYENHNIYKDKWTAESFWSFSEDRRVFDCDLPDWNECMPTPKLPAIDWEAEDYDKKKKKKKKKEKASKASKASKESE